MTLVVFVFLFSLGATAVEVEDKGGVKIAVTRKVSQCSSEQTAETQDVVHVHYVGKLQNGVTFDSSYWRKQPLRFQLGANSVIKGWEIGILDMCVGEARQLTIPPELGYGNRGAPPSIPPKATLVFDVELVDLVKKPHAYDYLLTAKMVAVPLTVALIAYLVYKRVTDQSLEEAEAKRERKLQKRKKK